MDSVEQARRTEKIRRLNDELRTTFDGGEVFITPGVQAFMGVVDVLECVKRYERFDERNDPHGEHDFGTFNLRDTNVFWKIDYYDRKMEHGSEDPADPEKTTRVLTIGLMSEY